MTSVYVRRPALLKSLEIPRPGFSRVIQCTRDPSEITVKMSAVDLQLQIP